MINLGLQRFNQKRMGWALGVVTSAVLALALVLLFLLTQATQKWDLYEQNYELLFALNAVVALALMLVIGWAGYRLVHRLRAGKFGSRLLLKLAAIFALIGLVPGILIYTVSYQFVSRSIESWFDLKVEGALDAGLNLGRSTVDNLSQALSTKVIGAASLLGAGVESGALEESVDTGVLERIKEQTNAEDVILWSAALKPIASVGDSKYEIFPEPPNALEMRRLTAQGFTWRVEGLEEGAGAGNAGAEAPRVKVLVTVSQNKIKLRPEQMVLQVTQKLPPNLVSNARAVLDANREYQERAIAREGLKRMYIGTLTLTLFLAVFGAILMAAILGTQLAQPLLVLAMGVRDVAAGDLSPKKVLEGRDELEGLTRAFADMTQQLANSRTAIQQSMDQVSLARANLQTILDNLTAGVMVLRASGELLTANPGASRILGVDLNSCVHAKIQDVAQLKPFMTPVAAHFENFIAEPLVQELGPSMDPGVGHWEESFEFAPQSLNVNAFIDAHSGLVGGDARGAVTLVARGAVLPNSDWLLVFDDISQIVSAQRTQAWGEVARRLAHEIKNPLTPIQLSAERLASKLQGKLGEGEQALLTKSVKTIVDQVDALKRLVNEFREFGRMPQADVKLLDLNELIKDVLNLYEAQNEQVVIEFAADEKCPPILGDAQLLRQVIHNLLQNAQDASESCQLRAVRIQTEWRDRSKRVLLSVSDSGPGFSQAVLQRAFEPYVTTKTKGTGLGLAVVKKIADEHNARIEIKNIEGHGEIKGAKVSIAFLTEKAG